MVKSKKQKRYTDEDKAAAVEMYLSGPNSMQGDRRCVGTYECQHLECVESSDIAPAIRRMNGNE